MIANPDKKSLAGWLNDNVFLGATGSEIAPDPADVEGFNKYIENYTRGLALEHCAVKL